MAATRSGTAMSGSWRSGSWAKDGGSLAGNESTEATSTSVRAWSRACCSRSSGEAPSALRQVAGVGRPEAVAQCAEGDAVLRPARARDARLDRGEVEHEGVVEVRARAGEAPQAVGLGIRLHERHQRRIAAREPQVR